MAAIFVVLATCQRWNNEFYCLLQHEYGDEASQAAVHKMLPNKVKRRRKVKTEDGVCIDRK